MRIEDEISFSDIITYLRKKGFFAIDIVTIKSVVSKSIKKRKEIEIDNNIYKWDKLLTEIVENFQVKNF